MSEADAEYFERLGRRFAEAQDEQLMSRDVRSAVRARLLAGSARGSSSGLVTRPAPWHLPRNLGWGLAAAVAFAACVVFFLGNWRQQPLSFALGSEQGREGQLVVAGAEARVPLVFSDGSLLELRPEARGRVLAMEPNGARVELERGSLQASVVHRVDTSWAVLAGPFQVAVTGTKFVTRWDPQTRELEVTVQEGSVLVSGGTLRAPERVTRGKTLRVVMTPSSKPAPSLSVAGPSEAEPSAASVAVRPAAPATSKAVAVDPESFRGVFEAGSPTDLMTLAKALRQRGDSRGESRALIALRTRFPADPRAPLAARSLSELALARRDCGEARRWLDAYLGGASTGAARSELIARVQACKVSP